MRLSVTLKRVSARIRPRDGTQIRRRKRLQARVGYLLGSRSDPTQTARVGFEQVGPVGRRME